MGSPARTTSSLRRSVERHYDSLALLYRTFWGQHIHHGLWLDGDSPPRQAQESLVSHLARRAQIRRGERVLDVGCGYGASSRWLSRQLDCPVTGITISRKQAGWAKRHNAKTDFTAPISIVRADAAQLPFAEECFDIVWVVECIEHLIDQRAFLLNAARTLRPGGRLALCTWQRGGGVSADDARVSAVCEAFLCPSLASMEEHRRWCVEAGLKVSEAENLTRHVSATWDILLRRVKRRWLAPLKPLLGRETRRFVDGFPSIAQAYESGAMSYGLLVAAKPGR